MSFTHSSVSRKRRKKMITQVKGSIRASRLLIMRVIALVVVIAALCAGTAFAASPSFMHNVDIYEGSTITRVATLKTDAEAIIRQAGIELAENDKLNLDGFTEGEDGYITVYRAATIEYTDINGNTEKLVFAGTVGEFLKEKGVALSDEIIVNLSKNTIVTDGLKLNVQPAHRVSVTADGSTLEVVIGNGTVADAIAKAGIALGADDETEPAQDTELSDAMAITVYRVSYQTRTVAETVAFEKKTENSAELYKGTSKVTRKGINGEKNVTYKDKYVDGKLVSSTVESEEITKEPIAQITQVGTKEKPVTVAALKNGGTMISELAVPSRIKIENGVPTSYKSIVTGKAAAYTAKAGAKTASGRVAMPGHIAVNPNQFPYGTELWIVSTDGIVYGYCIAADTGGFVNKGKFTVDLYMNTSQECYAWGSRNVIIYVL